MWMTVAAIQLIIVANISDMTKKLTSSDSSMLSLTTLF